MPKTLAIAKNGVVGETSSKYGFPGGGEQFVKDMQAHEERYNRIWESFVQFMKDNDVTPQYYRWLFKRYYEEYIE